MNGQWQVASDDLLAILADIRPSDLPRHSYAPGDHVTRQACVCVHVRACVRACVCVCYLPGDYMNPVCVCVW
jgi:hypothetical protein